MVTAQTREHRITIFPKQGTFVAAEQPFCAFIGGIGSGKSEAGAVKALQYMTAHPGAVGMVTAPTYVMLRDSTLRSYIKVFPEGSYVFKEAEMRLIMHNGSEALFRSTEDPDRLRGPNLAFVHMDEAAQSKAEAFKILQGRLRQPGFPQQLWITTTPKGLNWVYQEFGEHTRLDYLLVPVSTRDNPFLPPEFIKRLEASYAQDFALQEIEGQFVIVGGNMAFDLQALNGMREDVRKPIETWGGVCHVWQKAAPGRKYAAASDPSHGVGGDHAVTVVLDVTTGMVVADIQSPVLGPEALAAESIKLLAEYGNPIWAIEDNDWGGTVLSTAQAMGYKRLYYRDSETASARQVAPSKLGWHTDERSRYLLWGELIEAVHDRLLVVPSDEGLQQFYAVIRNPEKNGRPEAMEGTHDDYPMAVGIAWQMRKHAHMTASANQRPLRRAASW